jgi:hypothetical protein
LGPIVLVGNVVVMVVAVVGLVVVVVVDVSPAEIVAKAARSTTVALTTATRRGPISRLVFTLPYVSVTPPRADSTERRFVPGGGDGRRK